MTNFLPVNFAKVVDRDDINSLENFVWLIKFFGDNFTIFDFVRSTEGRVNKTFAVGKSQSATKM